MLQSTAILLVEDDPNDAFFVRQAIETRSDIRLTVVDNGSEAVQYLKGQQPYADRSVFPFPSLVLLDLKLPVLSGFEVLRWIRNQCTQKHLPVIVLTDSLVESDRQRAHELGASSYVVKPCHLWQLTEAVVQKVDGWLKQSSKMPALPVSSWDNESQQEAA